MSMRQFALGALVAAAALSFAPRPACAKPPDLPLDLTGELTFPPEADRIGESAPSGYQVRAAVRFHGWTVVDVDFGDEEGEGICVNLDFGCPMIGDVLGSILAAAYETAMARTETGEEAEELTIMPREVEEVPASDESSPPWGYINRSTPSNFVNGLTPAGTFTPDKDIPADRIPEIRHLYRVAQRCRRDGDLDMARNCYQEALRICPGCGYGKKAQQRLEEMEEVSAAEESAVPETPEDSSALQTPLLENLRRMAEQSRSQRYSCPGICVPPSSGQAAAGMLDEPETLDSLLKMAAQVRQRETARRLYQRALLLEKEEKPEEAARLYQKVHLLAPDSPFGKKAVRRLAALEADRAEEAESGVDEEQEAPTPQENESRLRRILESTEPLGPFQDEVNRRGAKELETPTVLYVDPAPRRLVIRED